MPEFLAKGLILNSKNIKKRGKPSDEMRVEYKRKKKNWKSYKTTKPISTDEIRRDGIRHFRMPVVVIENA